MAIKMITVLIMLLATPLASPSKALQGAVVALSTSQLILVRPVSLQQLDYIQAAQGCDIKAAEFCINMTFGDKTVKCLQIGGCASLMSSLPSKEALLAIDQSGYDISIEVPNQEGDQQKVDIAVRPYGDSGASLDYWVNGEHQGRIEAGVPFQDQKRLDYEIVWENQKNPEWDGQFDDEIVKEEKGFKQQTSVQIPQKDIEYSVSDQQVFNRDSQGTIYHDEKLRGYGNEGYLEYQAHTQFIPSPFVEFFPKPIQIEVEFDPEDQQTEIQFEVEGQEEVKIEFFYEITQKKKSQGATWQIKYSDSILGFGFSYGNRNQVTREIEVSGEGVKIEYEGEERVDENQDRYHTIDTEQTEESSEQNAQTIYGSQVSLNNNILGVNFDTVPLADQKTINKLDSCGMECNTICKSQKNCLQQCTSKFCNTQKNPNWIYLAILILPLSILIYILLKKLTPLHTKKLNFYSDDLQAKYTLI